MTLPMAVEIQNCIADELASAAFPTFYLIWLLELMRGCCLLPADINTHEGCAGLCCFVTIPAAEHSPQKNSYSFPKS